MKVQNIQEGITAIKKGMIEEDTDIVIFPSSLKRIEDGACILSNHGPYSFFYRSTYEDWKRVKVGEDNSIFNINFLQGSYIIKL